MKLYEIREMPTSIKRDDVLNDQGNPSGYHESLFKSFHIVNKIRELLLKGTPTEVLIEIIEDLTEARP